MQRSSPGRRKKLGPCRRELENSARRPRDVGPRSNELRAPNSSSVCCLNPLPLTCPTTAPAHLLAGQTKPTRPDANHQPPAWTRRSLVCSCFVCTCTCTHNHPLRGQPHQALSSLALPVHAERRPPSRLGHFQAAVRDFSIVVPSSLPESLTRTRAA